MEMYSTASSWDANMFQTLGVPRSASAKDIKAAYRKVSMEFHPDKNPSKDAEVQFLKITEANNVLSNDEFRDVYDRWGMKGLKWVETNQNVFSMGAVDTATFIITSFVLIFIMTLGARAADARPFCYGYMGVLLVVFVNLKYGDDDIPLPMFPAMTRYEKCELLGQTLSMFVIGVASVRAALYVDVEELMFAKISKLENQQQALLAVIMTMQGKKSSDGNAMAGNFASIAQALPPPQQSSKFPNIPSWIVILGIMGLSNYFGGS